MDGCGAGMYDTARQIITELERKVWVTACGVWAFIVTAGIVNV